MYEIISHSLNLRLFTNLHKWANTCLWFICSYAAHSFLACDYPKDNCFETRQIIDKKRLFLLIRTIFLLLSFAKSFWFCFYSAICLFLCCGPCVILKAQETLSPCWASLLPHTLCNSVEVVVTPRRLLPICKSYY